MRSSGDRASIVCPPPGSSAVHASVDLAPGGRMRQEIHRDPHALVNWRQYQKSRCFVHIANSLAWRAITGEDPPTTPLTSQEDTKWGLPWFDYYADGETAVSGSEVLSKLKSVFTLGKEKGDITLPENQPVHPKTVIELRKGLKKGQVREGNF